MVSERGSQSIPAGTADSSADIIKLRKVLALQASGWTQKQIAEHFAKDVRTIRRWTQEAKCLKLVVLEDLTPEDVLADFLFSNAELSWEARTQLQAAQLAGDTFLVLKCVRALSNLSAARVAALARVGLFDGFSFGKPKALTSGPGSLVSLQAAVRNVEAGAYQLEQGNERAEEDDDHEPLC
jgi:hypothetical protein